MTVDERMAAQNGPDVNACVHGGGGGAACETCHGSGANPAWPLANCPACTPGVQEAGHQVSGAHPPMGTPKC